MDASVFFQGGTLVVQHNDNLEHVPFPFQLVKSRWRCEAYRYHIVLPWMKEQGIRNAIPRWQHLALELHDTRELHEYQVQSIDAWKQGNGRGSIVLPTGAGKTLVAVHAIHHVSAQRLSSCLRRAYFTNGTRS
jgi:type III restriction/modification enzyme restriction subunit